MISPAFAGARFAGVLALVLLLGASSCGGEKAAFDRAMKDFDQGEMRAAAESLSRFLDRYPDGKHAPEALFQRGTIELLYLDDLASAAADFREIARAFPRSPRAFDARLKLAELAGTRLGDLDRARAEYERLLADFPDQEENDQVRYRLGEISFRQLRFDEARGFFGQVAGSGATGDLAEKASFAVARAWATEGKAAEAEAAWRDFLSRFPHGSRALPARLALAEALEQEGRGEDALALLQEVAEGAEDPAPIQARIARLKERMVRRGR